MATSVALSTCVARLDQRRKRSSSRITGLEAQTCRRLRYSYTRFANRFDRRWRRCLVSWPALASRKPCILQLAPQRIGTCQRVEILLDPEDLHHCGIRAHRGARRPTLDAPKCDPRHSSTLGHLRGAEAAPQAREAQAIPEPAEQGFRAGQ